MHHLGYQKKNTFKKKFKQGQSFALAWWPDRCEKELEPSPERQLQM